MNTLEIRKGFTIFFQSNNDDNLCFYLLNYMNTNWVERIGTRIDPEKFSESLIYLNSSKS